MRATQKYKGSKNTEHVRRIAQSLGYKTTIYDMPKMVALLKRAGIEIEGVQYAPEQPSTQDTIIIS